MKDVEGYLKEIESKLLPSGASFSQEQKRAILEENSANIVAGPGTGKTTILIAKSALFLKEAEKKKKGVCLFTHTNVAVNEIIQGLRKLGFKNLEYPHFIGTIQEFYNTFFAKNIYYKLIPDEKIKILEKEDYNERFAKLFEYYKPDWYKYSPPNAYDKRITINIYQDYSYSIGSDMPSSYRDGFNKAIKRFFEQGILNHSQCLALAKSYIELYEEKFQKAVRERFRYVLLDEAQDVDKLQYELLNLLFLNNEVTFQRYGDPNQAIYSTFNYGNDSWKPEEEKNFFSEIKITKTSRFSQEIVEVVERFRVSESCSLASLDVVKSFNPFYIVYKDGHDLLFKYRKLINRLEENSEDFARFDKKDSIVSVKHADLSELFPSYIKAKRENTKSERQRVYDLIMYVLAKELKVDIYDIKESLDSCSKCKELLAVILKSLFYENKEEVIKLKLLELLNLLSTEKEIYDTDLSTESLFINDDNNINNTSEKIHMIDDFYIGTVHSVKGETHRSTMLVLNTKFERNFGGSEDYCFKIFDLLKSYISGECASP